MVGIRYYLVWVNSICDITEGKGTKMSNKQRRLFLIVALLFAGSALAFISFGNLGENLVYYWDPSQVIEAGDDA